LAAVLPGIAAAAGLVGYTLAGVGPALATALAPVGQQFAAAQAAAAKFATAGIGQIGAEFSRVNMPAISSAMTEIGKSANVALREVGKFLTSADGITFVSKSSLGAATAFDRIATASGRAVAAIGRLASRADITGALTSLGDAVGRVVDRLTAWADSTSAADISNALTTAKTAIEAVQQKLNALRDIFGWMFANAQRLQDVSNAVALFGIALGVATGNPVTVAIAAISLLVNNWDKLKAAFSGDTFQGFVAGFKSFAQPIVAEVKPAITDLVKIVKRDVLPALKDFLAAIQPIVKWLAEKLGPIVSIVFKGIVKVIGAALKIVSGILNIFSGLITGRWSLLWKGVKQILSGAWAAIAAIVVAGIKLVGKLIVAAIRIIFETVKGIGKLVKAAGKGIGDALYSAGAAVASGFVRGIKDAWGYVTDTVSYLVNKIPSAVRNILGIASPSKVFAKIGSQTGAGLEAGLLASRAAVARATDSLIAIPDGATAQINLNSATSSTTPLATPQAVTLRIDSAGAAIDDLLLEILRKSIRTRGGNVQLVLGR
jgi:hypothetical protein